MTQKGNLFKGQQKKKTIPPNRHGKIPYNRKGKRVVKPSKMTKDSDSDRLRNHHFNAKSLLSSPLFLAALQFGL
ncbi:hypothetical protein SLEP1_g2831 [Rubroshorea leprosula]|uniref:Uncharacterized protein n=1 Tax=Rubroshorea leprosula TaxID=152421 RepID=A0AAV5HU94_9ROSI|nr:hypothetical protein SLEP1_g2831 [Rubroshorea leprosula]